MNTAPCNCQPQTKPSWNERPRYYARQLVTPDDLTLEQDYFRAKLRRHNRYLHGWGVVCGAEVVEANKPWKVIVKTGYILGPYGDEIFIGADQCVDVRRKCVPDTPDDEECLEAQPPPPPTDAQRFIAIRYIDRKTRLIRVPLGGCGCEENTCEYSRFADDYEICVIDDCPDSHKNPPDSVGTGRPGTALRKPAPECPECEDEPWVVLSGFTVDEEGKVTLEQCACRRQVMSFGDYWWPCLTEQRREPDNTDVVRPGRPATPTPPKPRPSKRPVTKPTPPVPVTPVP